MRILSILFLLIIAGCGNEQKAECNYITDYYPNTAKAEVEFYLGNYQQAFDYYQEAFQNCNAIKLGTHHDTDNFAKVCAELGKVDLALDYIEKTVDKGGTLNGFYDDEIFNELFKTDKGKTIIANYETKRKRYISTLNMDLRLELQKMIDIDQRLVGKQKERDSVFKVNDIRLVEIFNEIGYPNEQVIGNYGIDQTSSDPTILLLHTEDSIRINYFIPKVKEFIRKGKCPPFVLGAMYDNLDYFNARPQTHGTYSNLEMISDLKQVNKNRTEIGLPKLKITKKIDSLKRQ